MPEALRCEIQLSDHHMKSMDRLTTVILTIFTMKGIYQIKRIWIPDFPGVAVVELLTAPAGNLISSSLKKKRTHKILEKYWKE
jgi:hypothetical protein